MRWRFLFVALALGAVSGVDAALLPLPWFEGGGATSEAFVVDTDDGRVFALRRLDRDPLSIDRAPVAQNLFRLTGRSTDRPALPGELLAIPMQKRGGRVERFLLVETPTGYMAYLDDPGGDKGLGEVQSLLGRPAEAVAGGVLNYLFLPYHGSNDRTEGAFLFHGATGRCLFFGGLEEGTLEPEVSPCGPLPELQGYLFGAELRGENGRTTGFLLFDTTSGAIRLVDVPGARPSAVRVRETSLGLTDVFSGGSASYVVAGIADAERATRHVVVVDGQSGDVAYVRDVRSSPGWYQLASGVGEGGAAGMAAVPKIDGQGETVGLWLVLSVDDVRYLTFSPDPLRPTVGRVRFGG